MGPGDGDFGPQMHGPQRALRPLKQMYSDSDSHSKSKGKEKEVNNMGFRFSALALVDEEDHEHATVEEENQVQDKSILKNVQAKFGSNPNILKNV